MLDIVVKKDILEQIKEEIKKLINDSSINEDDKNDMNIMIAILQEKTELKDDI